MAIISRRSYHRRTQATSWEEIWEAGPYYHRLSENLEDAQHYAIFVGWQIDSRLPLHRPARPGTSVEPGTRETLREKVLRICESRPGFHFYFLMWDHAYFYVFERERWQGRIWEELHPRVHFIFDNRHPFGGSHHEKICILDGRVALCGGIDICDDRWDSPEHLYSDPRRSLNWEEEQHGPYHDLAVQVTGPVCAELQNHVAERWRTISSVPFPDPPSHAWSGEDSGHGIYFSRTLASIDAAGAGGDGAPIIREIEFLFRDLFMSASRRIVLEGQYFWSREITDLLVAKMHAMKGRDFEIVLVLAELSRAPSFTRKMSTYEMTLLERLEYAAKQSGTRLTMGAPYVHPPSGAGNLPPRPIYIHSKLLLVDDRYLCVGSANFTSRALRIDTEVSLTLEARDETERAHIRRVADHVLEHWGIAGSRRDGSTDIRLRPFHPGFELGQRGRWPWLGKPWHTAVPYQYFFDPELPWPYRFKRQFRMIAGRRSSVIALCLLVACAVGAALAVLIAGADRWSAAYAILLSSAWLLPVPFFPAVIVATLHLGAPPAARVAISALWIASLYGYGLTRMFPTAAARYYNRIGPSWLPERMGRRSFPALISVLSDPRVELRAKIAYQGLYCVPLPWFAFGTWVVLPAALYLGCRWIAQLAPLSLSETIRSHPATAIGAIFGITALRAFARAVGERRTPQDTVGTIQRANRGEVIAHAQEDDEAKESA